MLLSIAHGISVHGQTVPQEPPFVPDLNFNKSAERVMTLGHRATVDGRVVVQGCGTNLCFRLILPERLAADNTYMALADGTLYSGSYAVSKDYFLGTGVAGSGESGVFRSASPALCDVLPQPGGQTFLGRKYSVAEAQNPSKCGPDLDCYEVWVVVAFSDLALTGDSSELWSRKVRIEVKNPKSTSASIQHVEVLGVPHASPVTPALDTSADFPGTAMETVNVTGDGRVLLLSGGRGGLLYSYNPTTNHEACNAEGWSQFHPISHLAYDANLPDDYGIADFPIRDTEGNFYADNTVVRGTYPWLDRSGNNLFYSQAGATNPPSSVGGWDFSPVSTHPGVDVLDDVLAAGHEGGIADAALAKSGQAGLSFFGLWSRGKLVHLDGRANLSSYTINFNQLTNALKRAKTVLGVCTTHDCSLADAGLGSIKSEGLWIEDLYSGGEDVAINEARNTQLFSNENHFNYLPYLRTIDARDVTWQLHTSRNVMELAFDEYVSPHVLIHSSMVPTITAPGTTLGDFNIPRFHDGFAIQFPADPKDEVTGRYASGYTETPRVQNAATAEDYVFETNVEPPAYGELLGGARIEPIAAGGIQGRGVYLDGSNDRIRYSITTDTTSAPDEPWLISLWINAKSLLDSGGHPVQRELLHFPDGTIVQLKQFDRLRLVKGSFVRVVPFPTGMTLLPSYWRHFAIQVIPNVEDASWAGERTRIQLYVDGYLFFDEVLEQAYNGNPAPELFQITDGDLLLGWNPARAGTLGFRGWIDDFKVIRGQPNVEEVCRHAYGTLLGVEPEDSASLVNKAEIFPQPLHDAVTSAIPAGHPTFEKYVCDVHYPETDILSGDLPGNGSANKLCITDLDRASNPRCVGASLTFREGPLFWDAERPASLTNVFCGSCHTSSETRETMDPQQVLSFVLGLWAKDDPRRQPTQPPQKVFGVLPSHFIGHPNATETGDVHEIDPLVLEAKPSP